MNKKTLQQSFQDKFVHVPEIGCWFWMGSTLTTGYGVVVKRSNHKIIRRVKAHRLAWELLRGDIPQNKCVLHKCDNKLCVNPNHLFLGTRADNNHDCMNKKRHQFHERHHNSKLTLNQVKEIRISPLRHQELADKFNISRSIITRIKNNSLWKDA